MHQGYLHGLFQFTVNAVRRESNGKAPSSIGQADPVVEISASSLFEGLALRHSRSFGLRLLLA
jgi:hypothetical protein